MKVISNSKQFSKNLTPEKVLYLRVAFSKDDQVTYKCNAWINNDGSFTLRTDFNIRIWLKHLKAQLVYFEGHTENICLVQVIEQNDSDDFSSITVCDESNARLVEPTVENAIMILQQQATIERRANAQKKI